MRYELNYFGFGWGKTSHAMELDASGFDFFVLPETRAAYVLHSSPTANGFGFKAFSPSLLNA